MVTVLMSVFNGERYVGDAVRSILAQTFSDFEFLIFDDGSTDRTREVLATFDDPRIRIVENTCNAGLTANLVRGMNMAYTAYVARMDADDVCLPNRLQAQVEYLEAHPQVGLLGSAVTFFDDSGWEFVAYQPEGHEEIKCALFCGYTLLHPTVIMRREEFVRHGLNYDPAFQVSQDHDLWVRASRRVRCANLREPLVRMREHENKIGKRHKSRQRQLSDEVRRRQLGELGVPFSEADVELLGRLASSVVGWTRKELRHIDHLLDRILAANAEHAVFDRGAFVRAATAAFRGCCRGELIARNPAGLYYWQSKMRRFDEPGLRALAGLGARSVAALAAGRRA